MSKTEAVSPFHNGERQAQTRAGVGEVAQWAGGFIRDYFPQQHREFHASLPFLVVSGADADGRIWTTLIEGPDGFITSPDKRSLHLNADIDQTDPLATTFVQEADVGVIGIELATRRRNRFSGVMRRGKNGFTIVARQTFGNCPQYIHERAWARVPRVVSPHVTRTGTLNTAQLELIGAADTMFIGTGHFAEDHAASNGYDASHRGGAPGFVRAVDTGHLQIPDYPGNNFFNTIGNIISDPRVGLLFVDFGTGNLLHITGHASIDWAPQDPDALRVIDVKIDHVIERQAAVGLRWTKRAHLTRRLRLVRKEHESESIASLYFETADRQPLAGFEAGQHLPIEVRIPGQRDGSKRSYSLSGAPSEAPDQYRLSIKRDDNGLVSRFLHDELDVGSVVEAHAPAGDFAVPCTDCPLVLVSAGVGLTPMLAALHANIANSQRNVWFVHGTRNGRDHAMKSEVEDVVRSHSHLHHRVFYSNPEKTDKLGVDFDAKGRVTAQDLLALNTGPNTKFMLCGPAAFLSDIRMGLEGAGVPVDDILFETFGPNG